MNTKQMMKEETKSIRELPPKTRCSRCNSLAVWSNRHLGDILICGSCGKLTRHDAELGIVEIPFAELQAMAGKDPERINLGIEMSDLVRQRWIEQGCPSY
jgi:hypothetical protein